MNRPGGKTGAQTPKALSPDDPGIHDALVERNWRKACSRADEEFGKRLRAAYGHYTLEVVK